MNTNELIELFTHGEISVNDITTKRLECEYGFKLVQRGKSRFDERNRQSNKDWLVNNELGWGGNLKDEFPNRWDITEDASVVCYRNNFVEYTFFDVVILGKPEQESFIKEKAIADKEALERARIVDILTPVLIQQMLPFGKLQSGFLEVTYGIHLKQIQRDMHMHMKYKPRYGNVQWVANQVLCWGSNTGWDITVDGKIACCRINYDDYVNFEIEVLTPEQIESYRLANSEPTKDISQRMKTLSDLFTEGLISEAEYALKRKAIIAEI